MISAIRCGERTTYISLLELIIGHELKNIGVLDIGKKSNIMHPYTALIPRAPVA